MSSPTSAYAAESGPDDSITLYHHTTPEAALCIMRERRMISAAPVDMPYAFFSTRLNGNASGDLHYGAAAVEMCVPASIIEVDEAFHNGERYVKVRLDDLDASYFIRAHLPQGSPADGLSQVEIAAGLSAENMRIGPALPGYHWHSVVEARGWEQPRLDGGNGGQSSGFCESFGDVCEAPSPGVVRERMDPPHSSTTAGLGRER